MTPGTRRLLVLLQVQTPGQLGTFAQTRTTAQAMEGWYTKVYLLKVSKVLGEKTKSEVPLPAVK